MAERLLACQPIQEVLRQRLSRSTLRLFRILKGVRLNVDWLPELSAGNGARILPLACPALRARRAGDQDRRGITEAACRHCQRRHWTPVALGTDSERRFHGPCGRTMVVTGIGQGGNCLVRLILQSAVVGGRGVGARRMSGPASDRPDKRNEREGNGRRGSRRVQPLEFRVAVELMRMLARELREVTRRLELERQVAYARRVIAHLAVEDDEIRRHLRRRLPAFPRARLPLARGKTPQTVERMLDWIQEHYRHPLTLVDVGRALGRSPAHLSSLFSKATGMTFHAYLDQLRLARAKDLLADPMNRVTDIACAVGYASEDWFRHAFKAHTGLSPSLWRESGGIGKGA